MNFNFWHLFLLSLKVISPCVKNHFHFLSFRISCCLDTRTGWWSITRFTPLGKHLSYPGATPTKSTIYNVFLCFSTFNKHISCLLSLNDACSSFKSQPILIYVEVSRNAYMKLDEIKKSNHPILDSSDVFCVQGD